MLRNQTKTLSSNGFIMKPFELPNLEFNLRHPAFPSYLGSTANGNLWFYSETPNTIYIDFGDGSEIYTQDFNGNLRLTATNQIYFYTDGILNHTIKIWFRIPSAIKSITLRYVDLYDTLTENLALYNLNDIELHYTAFNDFSSLRYPMKLNSLKFGHSFGVSQLQETPNWLVNSSIKSLYIGPIVNYNSTVKDAYRLSNIKDLISLTIFDNRINEVPSTFKEIENLKYLCFGGSSEITTISNEIKEITQLVMLGFGYVSSSYFGTTSTNGKLRDWGVGIGGMVNLTHLYCGTCYSLEPTLPLGIENAPKLKTIYLQSTFTTQEKVDSFVMDSYDKTTSIGEIIGGNTILRGITIYLTTISNISPRPSGTYQAPEGYIQSSSNGTPSSPMEMIYVLVKQYRWTFVIRNVENNGNQTLTP